MNKKGDMGDHLVVGEFVEFREHRGTVQDKHFAQTLRLENGYSLEFGGALVEDVTDPHTQSAPMNEFEIILKRESHDLAFSRLEGDKRIMSCFCTSHSLTPSQKRINPDADEAIYEKLFFRST